jgi:hypothetical protein
LPGDVVIKLDGVEINGVDDLIRALDRDRIGRTLKWMCCAWAGCARSRFIRSSASRQAKQRVPNPCDHAEITLMRTDFPV